MKKLGGTAAWIAYRRLRNQLLQLPGVVAVGTFASSENRFTHEGRSIPTRKSGILITVREDKDVGPVMQEAKRMIGSSTGVCVEVALPELGIELG